MGASNSITDAINPPLLPDNRLLGAADYADVQPGYAPDNGPTNAGPLYDAYRTFVEGVKAAPGTGVQHFYDVIGQPNPLTGANAQWPGEISNFDKLATLLQTAGSTSLAGISGGAPAGALGAGASRVVAPIRAYHGSPHSFNRFDLSKIGTGEGAQAYGRGLYFAENERVARSYRDALSGHLTNPAAAEYLSRANGDRKAALALFDQDVQGGAFATDLPGLPSDFRSAAIRKSIEEGHVGSMYEVDLHADPASLLDWHKPLGQQSQQIQDVVAQLGAQHGFTVGPQGPGYLAYQRLRDAGVIDTSTATDAARASQSLLEAGVPGIQYRDGLSRTIGTGTLDKQKTSNYVMFDPARIEILRKYGLLGPAAVGGGVLGGEQQ